MSNRQKSPAIIILVGLMLMLPVTLFFWWWAENRGDETMDLRDGVSVLAPSPKWSDLRVYQGTITRESFAEALEEVYSEGWLEDGDHGERRPRDCPHG